MTDEQAYERIVDIVFKYEEKELPLLEDRNLNIEALNHIREALKKRGFLLHLFSQQDKHKPNPQHVLQGRSRHSQGICETITRKL